jgi:hypothetical protein
MKFTKSMKASLSEDVERGNLFQFLLAHLDLNSDMRTRTTPIQVVV